MMLATLSRGSQQFAWVLAGIAALVGLILALTGYGYYNPDHTRGPRNLVSACVCIFLIIFAVINILILQK